HNDHNLGNRAYMDAFPSVTILAHVETRKDMDRFGPGSASRMEKGMARLRQMAETGKTRDGKALGAEDLKQVKAALAARAAVLAEIQHVRFQSATMTFDHDLAVDLGGRVVEVEFLGRGNTGGDAVVYLPKEKIAVTGDLVVSPVPFFADGYPAEW